MAEPMKGTRRIKWGVAALILCTLLLIVSALIGYPASIFYIIGAISVVAVIAIARGLSAARLGAFATATDPTAVRTSR